PGAGTPRLAGTQPPSVTFPPAEAPRVLPATATVTIAVTDTAPPTLTTPANTVLEATSPIGAAFFYVATASDPIDGALPVNCSPASGSTFAFPAPPTVACTAADATCDSNAASFTVTMQDTAPAAATPPQPVRRPAANHGAPRG